MNAVERIAQVSRLERSSHTAFIENNVLFVWGGYQEFAGEDITFPTDEIWLYDLDRGSWERREITGDKPPDLMGCCGSNVNGTLYIFAGCRPEGYTDEMFRVDLTVQNYSWRRVTDTMGTTPTPRNKHSCWVHRDRLIYFGGYGHKVMEQNTSTSSFIVEEMTWATTENSVYWCWGWNNEVHVFHTPTATWSIPHTEGQVPTPRGCHASAVLGNKGYISGGLEAAALDMFCLDLETWTWTQLDVSQSCTPLGRSLFTMTPISDHTLFIYGGVATVRNTLNDAWQFNTQTEEWTKISHPHEDKPRVCHTACLGRDNDVIVFGGTGNMGIYMALSLDHIAVLRTGSQPHHRDMFVFQTQPYSLCRLCEDFIGSNSELFGKQLNCLPPKLRSQINKRAAFFSAVQTTTEPSTG